MIDKEERRKRLVDDFKKIAEHTGKDVSDAVAFAQNIPDEVLDGLEELGFGSERIKITNNAENLETKVDSPSPSNTSIFSLREKTE